MLLKLFPLDIVHMIQEYAEERLGVSLKYTSYLETGSKMSKKMEHLKHLKWLGDNFKNFVFYPSLKSLELTYMDDFNTGKLKIFKSLTYLNLPYHSYCQGSGLSLLPDSLKILKLRDYKGFIGNISNLDLDVLEMDSYENGSLENLSVLNLKSLSLGVYNDDISPLSKITSLTCLYLPSYTDGDLTPLASLKELKVLVLGLFEGDLSPLANLTSLEKLDLENYEEGDLSPLFQLPNLKQIYAPEYPGDNPFA